MHLSPYSVPIAGCILGAIAIIGRIWAEANKRRILAQERKTMLEHDVPPAEIERLLGASEEKLVRDPLRSLRNSRRAGIVLVSSGIGLMLFFVLLASILRVREVLSGGAVGIIPLVIGIGFFVDYNMQKRELSRFGLEVEPEPPDNRLN